MGKFYLLNSAVNKNTAKNVVYKKISNNLSTNQSVFKNVSSIKSAVTSKNITNSIPLKAIQKKYNSNSTNVSYVAPKKLSSDDKQILTALDTAKTDSSTSSKKSNTEESSSAKKTEQTNPTKQSNPFLQKIIEKIKAILNKKISSTTNTGSTSVSPTTVDNAASDIAGSSAVKGLQSVSFNGQQYNSIIDQGRLNTLVNQAAKSGIVTNEKMGGKNDMCLAIAETYGAVIGGFSHYDLSGKNKSSILSYSTNKDQSFYSAKNYGSQEEMMSEIKKQLDAGKPVMLHVNGNKSGTSRHYVTIVGYKSSAGSNLKAEDLLIWDSYNSTLRTVASSKSGYKGNGKDRFLITGKQTGRDYNYQILTAKV